MSSDQGGEPRLLQEEADPGPKTCVEDGTPLGIGGGSGGMVTSKGAGLNPNAKVWQEVAVAPAEVPADGAQWPPADITEADITEGYSESVSSPGCKPYSVGFTILEDSSSSAASTAEITVNGMDPPDLSFTPAETTTGTSGETKLTEERPLSSENLRESLKKELEFCFSRENLSKDLYLMSQMDSDQFVPIWTIASMESIKALTTDMELILDILRSSPMVQVDEKGEKVRPNHKRCIIILREVPETTPVEEVESLFKNDNCPKVISVEFAHNNNWYITFQSDTDAQQAHRYLREEVKTFQGKPIMARIKAINTFFAKNGYRSMDSSMYVAQQSAQTQSQYNPNLYMQHVYSPQQQYPLYGIVPQTWTPSPTPYFETPLAPFPNSGFVNGFSSTGHYKTGNNSLNMTRPFNRNRVPLYSRKNEPREAPGGETRRSGPYICGPCLPGELDRPEELPAPHHCFLDPLQTQTPPDLTSAFPHLSTSSDLNDDGSMAGRGRRTTYRGTRRRREEERITRPIPLAEVKVPPPKFDLAATNFPPAAGLCGQYAGRAPTGEQDVRRGERTEQRQDDGTSKQGIHQGILLNWLQPKPAAHPHGPPIHAPAPSVSHQEEKVERVADPPAPKVTPPTHPLPVRPTHPDLPSTQPAMPGPKPQPSTVPSTPATPEHPSHYRYPCISGAP
ncbi:hypothetical protein J4Q44_G00256440 [Coregonus suidteri]|uniref:HTH La-type RNA-binding domain-containing protein n=1 Tax=Coregonus suidteri TaxID=861788 RepID=A0AAN8LC55_9TELE